MNWRFVSCHLTRRFRGNYFASQPEIRNMFSTCMHIYVGYNCTQKKFPKMQRTTPTHISFMSVWKIKNSWLCLGIPSSIFARMRTPAHEIDAPVQHLRENLWIQRTIKISCQFKLSEDQNIWYVCMLTGSHVQRSCENKTVITCLLYSSAWLKSVPPWRRRKDYVDAWQNDGGGYLFNDCWFVGNPD